jgi:hypothetical protein
MNQTTKTHTIPPHTAKSTPAQTAVKHLAVLILGYASNDLERGVSAADVASRVEIVAEEFRRVGLDADAAELDVHVAELRSGGRATWH